MIRSHALQGNPDVIRDLGAQAKRLGVSKSLLSREIREGRMRAASAGLGNQRHRWLIRDSWADAWLDGRAIGGLQTPHEARRGREVR
jgi:hypothetical protein